MPNETPQPRISSLSPILAVPDVLAAVEYYTRVLGFDHDWLWKDPPVHGAVRHATVQIQFSLNPKKSYPVAGTQYFLFVNDAEPFHTMHRNRGAEIIWPLENKPWGMHEYTIRDPWGYELRFAGPEKYLRPPDAKDSLPPNIKIVERMPTIEEYLSVTKSVNWTNKPEGAAKALQGSVYGVIAIDNSNPAEPKTVGLLRIVGDNSNAFFIQDVAVMPSHQNQRIGTALVETAMKWIPKGAFVGLFTPKPSFYTRLGFQNEGGMHRKA